MRVSILLILPALLAACTPQRALMGQALSGKPPEIAGTLAGDWVVADLNGGGALPGSFTLNFGSADGGGARVSGKSGCNRFMGGWVQDGPTLKLGPLGGTMMACEGDVAELEQRFLAVLGAVAAVRFTADGRAELRAPDGRRLTLKRPPTP